MKFSLGKLLHFLPIKILYNSCKRHHQRTSSLWPFSFSKKWYPPFKIMLIHHFFCFQGVWEGWRQGRGKEEETPPFQNVSTRLRQHLNPTYGHGNFHAQTATQRELISSFDFFSHFNILSTLLHCVTGLSSQMWSANDRCPQITAVWQKWTQL